MPNAARFCKFNCDSDCRPRQILFFIFVPNLRAFLKYWLPPLVWMAVIFSFSSDSHSYQHSAGIFEPFLHWLFPQMPQAEVETIHHLIRKCCHLTEYAILALLLWRAMTRSKNLPPWSWPRIQGTMLLVCLYAATDEFHQSFVPTRTSLVSDVFIDTAGGAIGLLALWIFCRCRKPRK